MNNLLSELELAKNAFRNAVRLSAGAQGSWIADRYIESWTDSLSVPDLIHRLNFEAKIRHFLDGINLDDLVDLYQFLQCVAGDEIDRISSELTAASKDEEIAMIKTCYTGQTEELLFASQPGDVADLIYFTNWLERKLDFRCVGFIE